MTRKDLGSLVGDALPCDPDVTLPADVRAAIVRGEAAFKNQRRPKRTGLSANELPNVITSVIDQNIQDGRDANLEARARPTMGSRRQPPMIARLRAVMIVVDRLIADGVPFGVGPNSKMNKAIRIWLNERAKRSPDTRVSRRKQITPTAVRQLLRHVGAAGLPVTRKTSRPRQTTQDVARKLLQNLRARRTTGTD
jgi:hypothetical protein